MITIAGGVMLAIILLANLETIVKAFIWVLVLALAGGVLYAIYLAVLNL